jgi:hypothetical protein
MPTQRIFFFLIYVDVRASLHVPQLISQFTEHLTNPVNEEEGGEGEAPPLSTTENFNQYRSCQGTGHTDKTINKQ